MSAKIVKLEVPRNDMVQAFEFYLEKARAGEITCAVIVADSSTTAYNYNGANCDDQAYKLIGMLERAKRRLLNYLDE